MLRSHRLTLRSALAAACCLAAALPLPAAPLAKNPGATLIFPYFEVDLDAPDGRSTLISVGNVGEPVIAHATIWTDRGVPVYAWDIYLGANALATYNLRDIVAYGNVAPTRAPASFGGCGDPVATPALDAAELALLQKQLTGQDLGGNECAGEPREDITLATGSLTIDTVIDCRTGELQRWPNSSGYFSGPTPRASEREVLWGDLTLVDPAENFAQGFEAYALGVATDFGAGFGGWEADRSVVREALGGETNCSRTRFLRGGPFAARTFFFVYNPPPQGLEENECDVGSGGINHWSFVIRDEEGGARSFETPTAQYRRSGKLEVGVDLPTGLAAGYVELATYIDVHFPGVPLPSEPLQHLLMGAIRASGRFAVGVSGNPTDCQPLNSAATLPGVKHGE